MAAFRAEKWIEKAVESFRHQVARPGWEYELRVGVDACERTSEKLFELGVGHWFSEKNRGPYIIRNSLIGLEEATAYAPFDADDVMKRGYLRELLGWVGPRGIAGASRTQISEKGRVIKRRARFQGGVCVISSGAWRTVGGYRPWPIAADHDLIIRAKRLGIRVRAVRAPLYYRRVHENSLTRAKTTRLGGELRNEYWKRAEELCRQGRGLQVSPKTTELEWRSP